jgi:hypothetical protein
MLVGVNSGTGGGPPEATTGLEAWRMCPGPERWKNFVGYRTNFLGRIAAFPNSKTKSRTDEMSAYEETTN